MNLLYEWAISPFVDFAFLRRALVGAFALSLGCGPIGLFLMMRRMSLMGDAMSHAVLPGVAVGFIYAGLSLPAMSLGGFAAGMTVVVLAGVASRFSNLREDASLAAFYLLALALGVLLVSKFGSNVDLIHILFGSVLAVDDNALYLVAGISSLTLVVMSFIFRPLLLDSLDPMFLRACGAPSAIYTHLFMVLVVLNLVAGFQAMGTLMAVGLMMIPAACARLWGRTLEAMLGVSIVVALLSGYCGLLLSFHLDLPSGPAIILIAGFLYMLSLFFAPQGGFVWRVLRLHHLER